MSICEFRRVCAILPASQFNKQAASMRQHLRGPMFTHTKEACMRDLPHCTMLWHGCKNSNVHFGQICSIISGIATTPYKTTPQGACNTEQGLTIATYLGGARL